MTKNVIKRSKILKFYILNFTSGNLQIGKALQQKDHLKVLKTEMTLIILIGKGPNSS